MLDYAKLANASLRPSEEELAAHAALKAARAERNDALDIIAPHYDNLGSHDLALVKSVRYAVQMGRDITDRQLKWLKDIAARLVK